MSVLTRLVVPALLLALLWQVVDLPVALARLADVDPRWLLAGLLLVQVQVLLSALRWRLTAARLGHRIASGQVVREYYVATLLNQVLPGGVAGDAARVLRNRAGSTMSRVAQGVVLERLAGQLALVVVTLGGLVAWPFLIEAPPPRAALLALGTAAAMMLAVGTLIALVAAFGPPRLRRFAARVRPSIVRCWFEDGIWLVQGALSLAVTASYIGVFAAAALAVGAPLPLGALASVVPLALASMLLPFSVGGWGLREAAAAALWPLVGLAAEAGVATSLVYGLLSLAGAAPAFAFVTRRPRSSGRGGSGPVIDERIVQSSSTLGSQVEIDGT